MKKRGKEKCQRNNMLFLFPGFGEYYGIDILNIQEITRYEAPTRILNMPLHIWQGIINLGGNIIPVINLEIDLT